MGDPKKLRKKYLTPTHPWQKDRIDEEKVLMAEYGLKNKKELWRMNSTLRNLKRRVKELVPRSDAQAKIEKDQLYDKAQSLSLLSNSAVLEDILSLNLRDVLARRLQTLVWQKGLALTIIQARQLVSHGHIMVADKRITSPSYLVTGKEEGLISYSNNSPFNSADHPERLKLVPETTPAAPVAPIAPTESKEEKKPKSAPKKAPGKKAESPVEKADKKLTESPKKKPSEKPQKKEKPAPEKKEGDKQ